MTESSRRLPTAAVVAVLALSCDGAPRAEALPPAPEAALTAAEIRHLEPRPDSVGPQPTRFAWTGVEGAESYTLRIWTEADVRVALESGITETSVAFPPEARLPAGTYFWSVMAVRGDRPIAESGLAAFVVTQ